MQRINANFHELAIGWAAATGRAGSNHRHPPALTATGRADARSGLLLVTHDVELAALIADRTLILDGGVIVAEGKTAVVLSNAPDFAPQMVRLLPNQGILTIEEIMNNE